MLAMGYEKTGLGRRIALLLVRALGRNSLLLGYAATFSDTILALVTPSNTARSAGTMFPIMINLPPIYRFETERSLGAQDRQLHSVDDLRRELRDEFAFHHRLRAEFPGRRFSRKLAHVDITWTKWFFSAAPFGIPLLLALPVLGYVFIRHEVKAESRRFRIWANKQLTEMGSLSRNEKILRRARADRYNSVDCRRRIILTPRSCAFLVIALMLILRVVTWADLARNDAAWTTISLLATLVAMADGLARTGFIKWFASLRGRPCRRVSADRRHYRASARSISSRTTSFPA